MKSTKDSGLLGRIEAEKEGFMESRERLAAAPGADRSARSNGVSSVVADKLLGLPADQRDVLILKVQERKSYREIAEITGMSRDHVGRLVHSGLKSLARELRTAGVLSS